VRLRYGVLLLALVGLPLLFLGMTVAYYALAALAESLFAGGGAIANILTLMLITVMAFAALLTLAERKWSAAMQDRIGPNRANIGPVRVAGLPHFLADALKMLMKEDFVPERASRFLFSIAPALVFIPVFVLFAVVPVAPPVELFGQRVSLQVADPDFGILFVFAFASLAVYGTALAGWSSNNKFALLGAVRAASQMISYEVALGLGVVGVLATFSSLQLSTITDAQAQFVWGGGGAFDFGLPAWGIFLQPIGFILFFAAAFAETKRPPFDMPEGESEIVGYFVEYSGMKFGFFMLSEFVEIVVLSAVTATLFFGGYHLPFGEQWLLGVVGPFWLGAIQGMAFWLKVLLLIWLQLTIRWTFPRFRYDQIQKLGWKMLLPLGLVNVFVTAGLLLLDGGLQLLAAVGLIEIAILIAMVSVRPAEKPALAIER
jgi:NADH-quinone oxidoreductase subunit H